METNRSGSHHGDRTQHAKSNGHDRLGCSTQSDRQFGLMLSRCGLSNIIEGAADLFTPGPYGSALSCEEPVRRLERMLLNAFDESDFRSIIRVPDVSAAPKRTMDLASNRGKKATPVSGRLREELMAEGATFRFYIIVLEPKGGVGKTTCTMTAHETLKIANGNPVCLIDADIVNKNLSKIGLTQARHALNAQRIDFEGFVHEPAERLISGVVNGVVVDSAAGAGAVYSNQIPELARTLRASDAKVRLVIVRPLTLSPLVHDNIITFGTEVMTPDMGVLLVRNMGQGRSREDFEEFDGSPEYLQMRALGMAECLLESAGAKYSDMISGFGRTFADIALIEPEELGLEGRQRDIACRVFTRPVRLFLARWLYRQTTNFQTGLIESILPTL